jgi:hypothetical protein
MADHGLLFDQFPATRRSEHGGSQFDEGFSEQAVNDAHGKLYDLFGVPRDADLLKGEHFDEFGWKDVPVGHGALFDSDFRTEVPDSPHGTWFDALDGAQVRFVCNGVNLEGTVINVKDDYATVSTSGSEVEVSLQQFLQYRSPALDNHSPGLPDETAEELPSARNETAHGAFDGARSATETGERVVRVGDGPGNPDARTEAPAGLHSTFDHLKTAEDALDVIKGVGSFYKKSWDLARNGLPAPATPTHVSQLGQDHQVLYDHPSKGPNQSGMIGSRKGENVTMAGSGGVSVHQSSVSHVLGAHGYQPLEGHKPTSSSSAPAGASAWKSLEDSLDVLKDVSSAETATQGGATDVVKHRKGCPRSGGGPCGAINEDGKCSACQASVRDHEVIGKRAPDGTPGNEHIVNNGCQHCGKPMNPVDAMVGMQRDGRLVCHDCAKGLHSAAAAGKVFKPRPWTDKSLDDTLDVLKTGDVCAFCHKPASGQMVKHPREGNTFMVTHAGACAKGLSQRHAQLQSGSTSGKTLDETLDVLKGLGKKGRIGSTDQQLDAPETKHSDKQIEEENSPQSAGKARVVEGDPGITPEKRGKPSDHNMPAEGEQRTCPHCGHILAKEAELAEQGAPSHKCAGSGLDALKTLVTA